MAASIDINCDLGESFGVYRLGEDDRILDFVTSANVACGFHAGDPATMHRTVNACLTRGVAIGAHPGLPDLAGFGRRAMSVSPEETYDLVLYQLGALGAFVRSAGATLRHVKPHGALYHMAETNAGIADAIVNAVAAYDDRLSVYGMANGELVACAHKHGLRAVHEAFVDRTYETAVQLAPRTSADAVISDKATAVEQALSIAAKGFVRTVSGELAPLNADTLCIHGDTAHAALTAEAVHRALLSGGVSLKPPHLD